MATDIQIYLNKIDVRKLPEMSDKTGKKSPERRNYQST
jgi:hypothetical protein